MITKQELIDIMKEGWQQTGYYSVNFNANMVADKILERIKKELEVLCLLKSKISILNKLDVRMLDYPLVLLPMTKEERDKIKEWLSKGETK